MKIVKNPGYLWIPAYIVGGTAAAASVSLIPGMAGIAISSVLVVSLLTPFSLLHGPDLDLVPNLFLYCFCSALALLFALSCIPAGIGPLTSILLESEAAVSWLQVAFFVIQQAAYFGIHAFIGQNN